MGAKKGQKRKAYTTEEIKFIIDNVGTMFYSEIGKVLDRSKASIKNVSRQLNLSTPSIKTRNGNRKPKEKPTVLPTSKICTKCKENKFFNEFNKAKLGAFGLKSICRDCQAKEAIEYNFKNKEGISARGKKYREEKREQISAQRAIHTAKNKERRAKYQKQWRLDNPGKANARTAKRRAARVRAIPKGLTKEHWEEIWAFYDEAARLTKETGIPHEVDHIEPLQGKEVCGFHAPWNLRVITESENRRKSFKRLK